MDEKGYASIKETLKKALYGQNFSNRQLAYSVLKARKEITTLEEDHYLTNYILQGPVLTRPDLGSRGLSESPLPNLVGPNEHIRTGVRASGQEAPLGGRIASE